MSDLYSSFSFDDFNGKSAVTWKEKEWHRYINESNADVGNFYNLLIKYKDISNHLDVVFAKMSWLGISNKKSFQCEENDGDVFFYGEESLSIHKSPIFIATRGLMFFLEKICDILVANINDLDVKVFWKFSKAIGNIKENMFIGIYLIDVGELWPAICHFKMVMDSANLALGLLNGLHSESQVCGKFIDDFRAGIFDIRELAWKSIAFCRDELKTGFSK